MQNSSIWSAGPRIYNLFPLLAGPLPRWRAHLERARQMEFNWVFINPFQLTGHSGSLYSIKDYYSIDSRLLEPAGGPPLQQLADMIQTAKRLGLRLMMDLVINHTAFDSPLLKEHPAWYKRGADGEPLHPGALEGNRRVTWGDLIEVDNAGIADRDGLWRYWLAVAEHYAALGFDGFRCDAAYKVPVELWRFLIGSLKRNHPAVLFFAESLGCPFEQILPLTQSGFDFIFNSSKWWDFVEPWCLQQYRQTAELCQSVSFAESHDTERLAVELRGDREAVKMRYAFSALFSSGVMMPMGFEYGFRRRLHVVETRRQDWEEPRWDLSEFITRVNRLKGSQRVFNEEGPIEELDTGNVKILALVKSAVDRTGRALVLLNKDRLNPQACMLARTGQFLTGALQVEDLSPEGQLQPTPDFQAAYLKPSGVNVVYARLR